MQLKTHEPHSLEFIGSPDAVEEGKTHEPHSLELVGSPDAVEEGTDERCMSDEAHAYVIKTHEAHSFH